MQRAERAQRRRRQRDAALDPERAEAVEGGERVERAAAHERERVQPQRRQPPRHVVARHRLERAQRPLRPIPVSLRTHAGATLAAKDGQRRWRRAEQQPLQLLRDRLGPTGRRGSRCSQGYDRGVISLERIEEVQRGGRARLLRLSGGGRVSRLFPRPHRRRSTAVAGGEGALGLMGVVRHYTHT